MTSFAPAQSGVCVRLPSPGVAFLGFGAWTLRDDALTEDEDAKANRAVKSVFGAAAVAFFLAELGDKTMLATISSSSEYC